MEDENKRLKMAVISGASHAIKYKERKPRASEQEIIQYVSDNVSDILSKMDEEL